MLGCHFSVVIYSDMYQNFQIVEIAILSLSLKKAILTHQNFWQMSGKKNFKLLTLLDVDVSVLLC